MYLSKIVKHIFAKREAAIFLALLGISLGITLLAPRFATTKNFYLVTRQISFVTIVALGELFVILTAGIDLSVGSVVGFSGVITALAMNAGIPAVPACALGLLAGAGLGCVNGILVAYVKIAPFIVTLGMLSIARGAIWGVTKGWPITNISPSILFISQGQFLGIPVSVIIAVFLAVIAHIILRYTIFGRRTFAIGGNEEATSLSGIPVKKMKLMIYVISGLLSAMTGIMLVARLNSAQPTSGEGMELDAIAATVIGGTSLMGGVGSVPGVLIGAAIMGVIRNGLVMMKVSPYWQTLVIGTIIILAAVVDKVKNK
jgi:ribose/xylose/arabinose/galactoside ABC-type transport system permease subunit